jgi:hypothetical protein
MNKIDLAKYINELTYTELEPRATYIHGTADDEIRYFIPSEVLVVLAWIGTNIVLPILTGAAGSTILEKLKKRKNESQLKALELQKKIEEVEKLKIDAEAALEKLNAVKPPSEEKALIARVSLAEVLKINGWPSDLAEKDAERIVLRIRNHLWTPKD